MSDEHIGNRLPHALAEGNVGAHIASAAAKSINDGASPFLVRVVVEEVIFDPTVIDDKRAEFYQKGKTRLRDVGFLRNLPPNTIIGRLVRDNPTGAEESQYFFPMFPPHMMFPVKAGEHVWAFFENGNKENAYGFWMFRISEPRNVDDVNLTHADRKFHVSKVKGTQDKFEQNSDDEVPHFGNGPVRKDGDDEITSAPGASYGGDEKSYERLIRDSDSGKVSDFEDVPRFKKRPGDLAVQGSNNTLIVLGTDRTGAAAELDTDDKKGKIAKGKPTTDKKGKAGSIDVVVGRGQGTKTKPKKVVKNSLNNDEVSKAPQNDIQSEGDPDFETDLGRIYLSMKTDVDKNFNVNLKTIPKTQVGDGEPAGVIKVDHLRIIARKTIKLLVQPTFDSAEGACAGIVIKSNGEIIFVPSDAGVVKIGGDDADKAVLCTRVNNRGAGGQVTASPIVDTMAGVQGAADGLNGVFGSKLLVK